MKKVSINWKKINEFIDLPNTEKSELTGVPAETWSRIKSGKRSLTANRIREIASKVGLNEVEMHAALVVFRDDAVNAA